MSVLSDYLATRKQRRVLRLLVDHAGRCKAISHTLRKICEEWSAGETEAALINKEKIHSEEKSADIIEMEFILEVAQSELPETKLKEDLIAFVRMLDLSAGSAKRSATNMLLLSDYPLPEKFAKLIKQGSKIIFEMFTVIEKAVKKIRDVDFVISKARKVDELEDQMDVIYSQLKAGYFEIEKVFRSSAALVILDHVVRDLESCADKGEDAIEILAELVQRKH